MKNKKLAIKRYILHGGGLSGLTVLPLEITTDQYMLAFLKIPFPYE